MVLWKGVRACARLTVRVILDSGRNHHLRMGFVVAECEVRRTEVEYVFYRRVERECREGSWLARKDFFYRIKLIVVNVRIREGVHQFFHGVPDDLSEHHTERSVLDDIRHDANWYVGTALKMMNDKLFCVRVGEDMNPSMTGGDDNLARESFVLKYVLRYPWRYEVGS